MASWMESTRVLYDLELNSTNWRPQSCSEHTLLALFWCDPTDSTVYWSSIGNRKSWKVEGNCLTSFTTCTFRWKLSRLPEDKIAGSRSRRPCGLRRRFTVAWSLGSQVRTPLGVWMLVCCVCCVLCRQLPLRRADHSFRGFLPGVWGVWGVWVCVCVCVCVHVIRTPQRGSLGPNMGYCAKRQEGQVARVIVRNAYAIVSDIPGR
jgi:hypothetical protein